MAEMGFAKPGDSTTLKLLMAFTIISQENCSYIFAKDCGNLEPQYTVWVGDPRA